MHPKWIQNIKPDKPLERTKHNAVSQQFTFCWEDYLPMAKTITYNEDARRALERGFDMLAEAVAVT
ncbi:MAG TPA: hypothetical protein VEZ50_11270, partial [Nodosilinea sp.]|nr:hypothetical protein [Nodosilinea sp.]